MRYVREVDQLDVTRAALCCLSYQDDFTAKPVHFQRLSAALKFHIPKESLAAVLDKGALLKEFARLSQGYWFPGPLRRVPFHNCHLVIGPHPTTEIQRTFSRAVNRMGQCRVADRFVTLDLPAQPLNDWMGRDDDLRAWTLAALSIAKGQMQSTVSDAAPTEAYTPLASTRWTRTGGQGQIPDGIYMCRRNLGNGRRNYLFGAIKGRELTSEAPLTQETRRLRFGIDMLSGRTNRYRCRSHDDLVVLSFFVTPPEAEHRLLTALALSSVVEGAGTRYKVPEIIVSDLQLELEKVGLYPHWEAK